MMRLGVVALLLVACSSKGDHRETPVPVQTGSGPVILPVEAGAAADAAPARAGETKTYAGTYTSAPGTYYIAESKEFASVKQAKDDPAKHVGEGNLALTIDGEGRVAGTIDSGPVSPAIIDGSIVGERLHATVRRKDTTDNGLTGTLHGKLAGDGGELTLSLAESNAAIVRTGKATLKKK